MQTTTLSNSSELTIKASISDVCRKLLKLWPVQAETEATTSNPSDIRSGNTEAIDKLVSEVIPKPQIYLERQTENHRSVDTCRVTLNPYLSGEER